MSSEAGAGFVSSSLLEPTVPAERGKAVFEAVLISDSICMLKTVLAKH